MKSGLTQKKSHVFSNKPRFSMLTKKSLPVNGINLTALLQLFLLFLRLLRRQQGAACLGCWAAAVGVFLGEDHSICHPESLGMFGLYPLVNVYITMERSTIFHGKIHFKWPFSIAMLVHQRVTMARYQKNTSEKFNKQTAPRSSCTCSKHILCCWGSHRASRLNTYRQFPHQLPQWMRVTWSPARVEATNFRCWKPWISTVSQIQLYRWSLSTTVIANPQCRSKSSQNNVVLTEIIKVISGTIKHTIRSSVWSTGHDDDDVGIVLTIPKHLITKLSDK